tara:strand:+ start:44 stop:1747 length:1704 start_codon:yes stop_codon:yes gene_type:complete
MRRCAAVFCVIILLAIVPGSSAQELDNKPLDVEFDWSYELGDVFVSTKPLIEMNTIFVRTSTSNPNSDSAGVFAFDYEGEMIWNIKNSNSTFHDMSPILFVDAGQGDCGSWTDMLVIGWSDGNVEALNPNTGETLWKQKTKKITWGITGSMLVDEDNLVVPTRNGLAGFCLANGNNLFDYETGLGWRNGVSKLGDRYFLGDENGKLWSVSKAGIIESSDLNIGKIRHAPLVFGDKLLIHGQGVSSSSVVLVNASDFSVELISTSGPSPGIPISMGETVITSDLNNLGLFRCLDSCTKLDQYPFISNGEMSVIQDNKIMLPKNTVEGGWGIFSITNNSNIQYEGLFSTINDWYGTSAPEFTTSEELEILVFANDNGILEVYTKSFDVVIQLEDKPNSDYYSQFLTLILMVLMAIVGIQYLREKYSSAFRFLIVLTFSIFLFSFSDIVSSWSQYIDNSDSKSVDKDSLWQDEWPEEWLGTQVIIFEFDNQTITFGGITGEETALSLTLNAAYDNQITVEMSDTAMGKYIQSFNQQQGDGWIFFVDGSEAMVSAEYSKISSDSIVHWKMV